MRTNGFALFRGPGAGARAERAAARVDRYNRAIVTSPDHTFGTTDARGREVEACFVAYSLEEGEGLPLVHGFAENPGALWRGEAVGEFAYVTEEEGRVLAGRDSMGTRALYSDAGFTCVASDHRFFPLTPVLFPRGARIDVGSGEQALPPRALQAPAVQEMEEAVKTLCGLLERSVARRVKGWRKVAVSFSGGLDSSLIALLAAKSAEVVLCSAYTERSSDQVYTVKAAERLGLEHLGTVIGPDDAAREVRAMDLPFEPGPMDKALWCLYSTTSRMGAENGAPVILLGQLADELFGGYMKYALRARESEASAVRMMESDVAASAERAFVRDELACARFAEVRLPFADQDVADFALAAPLSYKIKGTERKAVLRAAASMLGLPEELVRAPKKAAQYSTGLTKLFS